MTQRKIIDLECTRVFSQVWNGLNDNRIRGVVCEGGSRSSKTWSICQAILALGHREKARIVIARFRRTWIKPTVLDTFIKVCKSLDLWDEEKFNKTELIYHLNGASYEFYGLDDAQKLHGIECDYFWLNEAIETSRDDFDQLEQRCLGKWLLDYNPSTDEHWIYDSVLKREDVRYVHSTQLDNPYLPASIREKILSYEPNAINTKLGTADEYKWKVYGLGQRTRREGAIYTWWEETSEFPSAGKWIAYGLDWGFTHDPTALVEVVYQEGKLWVRELIYQSGLTNSDIASRCGLDRYAEIIADSAEPKSIEELRRRGFRIRGVKKGTDSVRAGIDKLKSIQIMVHKDSMNIIRELRAYSWKRDHRTNQSINIPEDDNNHALDAIRYVAMEKLNYGVGKYSVR
jgi:phage terminase large subunit